MLDQATPVVISAERPPDATGYGRLGSQRRILLGTAALVTSISFGLGLALSAHPMLLFAVAVFVVCLPLIWRQPRLTVYLLIGGAATFESFALRFPDSLTDRIPFFKSFDSLGGSLAIPFTPAECLMLAALLIVMIKRIAARQRPLAAGPLFPAVAFYTAMVLFGLVYGVGSGGNLSDALWEARAQIYLFLAYLLVYNLISERRQVRHIIWIFLIAVAVKGLLGSWRYLVTLGGDLAKIKDFTAYNSLLSHEESFFFALFFAFVLIAWLFRSDRKQLRFALLLSLPVLLAMLANQRRAGFLALFLCVVVAGLLAYFLVRSRRPLILRTVWVAAFLLPVYVLSFGNSAGLVAQPARAIASIYQPNARDANSNLYREIEAENLKYNIQDNPVMGRGYGKPIETFIPVPDLSEVFSFWDLIPHNTILWVWMRLGFVGFVAFWFLIGRTVIEAALNAKRLDDPYLRGIAVFSLAAIVAWVAQGAVDMGLADFRATILVGTLIALLSRMPELRASDGPGTPRK